MLKLIEIINENEDRDGPSISVINRVDKSIGLEKKAAHEDIQAYIETLDLKPGYTYLLVNAMTSGEIHGSNLNGDYFPEDNLKKYYKTFETNPAYVFRSHINKDPSKSYGKVIYSIFNDRMHRIELICECKDELVNDINSRIKAGEYPKTSMALRTKADTCSICGNVAHSRAEYCHHLRNELNRVYPDGRKVMAINNFPLSAHDISFVIRPADVNSSVLQKIADSHVTGSAELAELEGLTEEGLHKKAKLVKLSELIKEINDGCYVMGAGKSVEEILGRAAPKDLPLHLVEPLHHFDLSQTLTSLADMGISPSIKFLAELIARKKLGPGYEGIGEIVETLMREIPHDAEVPVMQFEETIESSGLAKALLQEHAIGSSLLPEMVEKRASNVGYAGNGPHVESTYAEEMALRNMGVNSLHASELGSISYTKLLLGIGGAALLAKYFITSQIEKKLREERSMRENGAKITIVKMASDFRVTSHLAKLAMVDSLPPMHRNNENKSDSSPGFARLGLSVTKRVLKNTGTKIGGKLANLIRVVSFGSKMTELDYPV